MVVRSDIPRDSHGFEDVDDFWADDDSLLGIMHLPSIVLEARCVGMS